MTDEYSLLLRCIGRDKWLAAKRIPDGAEHIHGIFAGGRDKTMSARVKITFSTAIP
jgi:hypothetical protein